MSRKEYTCYMGKEMEECCQAKVKDALARRTSVYMLVMAVALLIISLTIKTSENEVFTNQVSFASTITSIILSVIAIWMSISGERQNSEIKERVVSASDKLFETVSKSQDITSELIETLEKQKGLYDNISNEINRVDSSIGEMKELFTTNKESKKEGTKENIIENDYLIGTIKGLKKWEYKEILVECMNSIFVNGKENISETIANICNKRNIDKNAEGIIVGVICVFYHNGFFDEKSNKDKLVEVNTQFN